MFIDYEKKYKEALERAKNLHKDAIDMGETLRAKQCEIIFPELVESEFLEPAWSEEDVAYIDELTEFFEHCGELHQPQENVVRWLKSLKQRIG